MSKSLFQKKLFSFLAFVLIAGFSYGQTVIYTESFEDTLNFTHTPNFQTDGSGDYFWWGQDGDFGMVNLDGEDGTYYIGSEDTDADGMPGECVITLNSVSLSGYSNVLASIMLAAPRTDAYDDLDYIIFEYEKNNSGTFEVLGAFYGHDWANGDAFNGDFREDTDLNGAPDSLGTILTSTFQTFEYSLDPTASTVILRVRWRGDSGNEEIALDKIQLFLSGPTTVDVTLNVNMAYQTTLGNFNPLTDFVDIAGTMNNWANPSGTAMTDIDGDNIWTVVLTGQTIGATLEYKFRINGTSWESIANNRTYTVVAGTNEVDHWYNDNAGPQDVTLTIVDGTAAYLDIEMKGSFDSWNLHQMYDDGTNGDVTSGDHTWTLTMSIPGGSWEWGAIENDGSPSGLWLIDGGNPTFAVNTDGTVTGQTEYVIPTPGVEVVIFCVNMQQQITLGNFNATTDFVDVAGNFNNFGGSAAMDDTDGDGIYCITIGGFDSSYVAEFKFRKNGTDWEALTDNRTYTVMGGGTDSVIYWFNDVAPPAPTGIFFSEYIEGSGNNKALEIYNGTGATVNLDDYAIAQSNNGNGWQYYHTFPTGATLADGDVWVIITNQTDTNLYAPADANEVLAYPSVVHHNGNDARAVVYWNGIDYSFVDIIGFPDDNVSSTWSVAGVSGATANHTLVRKGSVLTGNTDWVAAAGTDSVSSEWIVFPQNTFDYLGSHPNNFTPMEDLTVNVNMSYQISLGNFNPLTDTVYVAGSFNAWGGAEMADPDGDSIYTVLIPDLYVGTLYEYKFHINYSNWESINNREYTMVTGTNEVTHWFNNMSPPYDVLFTVIDGTMSYTDINFKSFYDGWNWHQMYDDGTNGDVTSGDNTWSVILNVPGGTWDWGAIEDDGSVDGLWLILGTNPSFTLAPDGTVTGQTSYEIPAPGTDSILFNVNMNYQITLGNFDPLVDFVDVAGDFNAYSSSGAMDDADGDGIYSLWIDGFTAAQAIQYKFRINGTGWETMPGNRNYTVNGGGMDTILVWFNNAEPPPPNTLFFSEYIEGDSYNKALEIYNNTGATVNLDDYQIAQSTNGGGWQYYHTFPAGATLAQGDVWVIVNESINTNLFDTTLADEVLGYPSVVYHNGDDARAIIKIVGSDTTFVDIFGDANNDPGTGWPVAGVSNATANHTLVRKAMVMTGNTDWAAAFGTNATNSEWKVLDNNIFTYLGSHPHVFDTIANVTFNVNMSEQQALGNFNPLVDFVDIAGTMNNWSTGDNLTDIDGDMIYTITFDSVAVGTIFEFKFRINGSWSDLTAEFPYGGPARVYNVQDGVNEVDYWYNDVQPAPVVTIHDIQYTTDPSGDSPYKGGLVVTSGVVTATLSSGYFIQNGIGMWNGVYVYDNTNTPAMGDHITIKALVDEYFNLTELKDITEFTINSSGNTLPPAAIASTLILSSEEAYEGVLVKAVSAICTNPAINNYGEWEINDGTGPAVVDDRIYSFTADSAHMYDITGVMYFSFGYTQLLPRSANDIQDVTQTYDVQTLSLVSGWSIFSTYIDPFEPLLDSIFNSIISQVRIIKDGNGLVFWPQFNLNAIGNITIGYGYQINMLSAQTLDITGTAIVPETTPFTIVQGWSMIGYLRNTPANMVTLFSPIVADIIIIKNGNGLVYWPLWGLNAIGNMIPGEGYQSNLTQANLYTYPANGPLSQTSKSTVNPLIFNNTINTGSNMTLGIPVSAWEQIPSTGSEIGVYNQAGELCGSSVFTGDNLAVAIWGDDELTPETEAMQEGETFSIKVWDKQTNQESNVVVEAWETGNDLFGKNAIAVVGSLSMESSVLQNFPNPATTYTEIEFSISEDGHASLTIYNILGEQLAMPVNQTLASGTHKVLVNTEAYRPGVYFYSLKTSKSTVTKSMQVIK
ncbi:MAG: lamin tail domain-containing protein [Bacteroidales bacterium]|nr:lamin tail domain-containing protein [Bacteroidales bacterium]MCF8456711.1 lamin tail domain-containing protein [Bacteroidales bacterium]